MNAQEINYSSQKTAEHLINKIANDKILKFVIVAMLLSYFYNLPFIKYSLTGSNELRIYDVAGVFVIYYLYIYNKLLRFVIKITKPFKWLWMFLLYASFMILVTLFFFIYFDAAIYFIQAVLYLYHFYVFFFTAVFLKRATYCFFCKQF